MVMKAALVDIDGTTFTDFAPLGSEFPINPPKEWVEVPDNTGFDWTWNGTQAVPPTAPTFQELKDAKKDELRQVAGTALNQGVDGPQAIGEAAKGPRSWPTDQRAWSNLLVTLRGRAVSKLTVPYVFFTLKDFDTGENGIGDLVGLGDAGTNNTVDDLETAMFAHRQAVSDNAKTKAQEIDASTNETELNAVDLTTGWPPLPVNP